MFTINNFIPGDKMKISVKLEKKTELSTKGVKTLKIMIQLYV